MRFPHMVVRVRCGSNFGGHTSQTTLVYVIYFRISTGMSAQWITLKVSVPLTRWLFGPLVTFPTPWHNRPSSLGYDSFQFFYTWYVSAVACILGTVTFIRQEQAWPSQGEFFWGNIFLMLILSI